MGNGTGKSRMSCGRGWEGRDPVQLGGWGGRQASSTDLTSSQRPRFSVTDSQNDFGGSHCFFGPQFAHL